MYTLAEAAQSNFPSYAITGAPEWPTVTSTHWLRNALPLPIHIRFHCPDSLCCHRDAYSFLHRRYEILKIKKLPPHKGREP